MVLLQSSYPLLMMFRKTPAEGDNVGRLGYCITCCIAEKRQASELLLGVCLIDCIYNMQLLGEMVDRCGSGEVVTGKKGLLQTWLKNGCM
jgi:hypothetical protein